MSSCISVKLQRISAVSITATKEPDVITDVSCFAVGSIFPAVTKLPGIEASVERVKVTARVSHVCTPNIRHPYLEIEPEVIWVYPEWAVDNNVFSNTHWRID